MGEPAMRALTMARALQPWMSVTSTLILMPRIGQHLVQPVLLGTEHAAELLPLARHQAVFSSRDRLPTRVRLLIDFTGPPPDRQT